MKRRQFLRNLAGASMAAGAFVLDNPLRPRFRIAKAAPGKTLVVVFQRGGCDGLNTVVPYGDAEYYNLRRTIDIAEPNSGRSNPAIDLDGFFGLHPSLAPFKPLYDAGDLAILPTVHYPNASRSHFDGEVFIESAQTSKNQDGWLNRHIQTQSFSAQMRAVGLGGDLPQSMRGSAIVSSFRDLRSFSLGVPMAEETEILDRLTSIYAQNPDAGKTYSQMLHSFGQVTISDLAIVNGLDADNYAPENGAQYPDTTLGRQMRDTALLIKQGLGLELAALSIGGWDNHGDQGGGEPNGSQARRFSDFSGSIAAFYTDLGTFMNDVIVLTMTEFGRTAEENGSQGTDHGHASSWFVLGKNGSVNGGQIHMGPTGWPGLTPDVMVRGRYLDHTVDYRDIYGEVFTNHLDNAANLGTLIPNHSYAPVGVLA